MSTQNRNPASHSSPSLGPGTDMRPRPIPTGPRSLTHQAPLRQAAPTEILSRIIEAPPGPQALSPIETQYRLQRDRTHAPYSLLPTNGGFPPSPSQPISTRTTKREHEDEKENTPTKSNSKSDGKAADEQESRPRKRARQDEEEEVQRRKLLDGVSMEGDNKDWDEEEDGDLRRSTVRTWRTGLSELLGEEGAAGMSEERIEQLSLLLRKVYSIKHHLTIGELTYDDRDSETDPESGLLSLSRILMALVPAKIATHMISVQAKTIIMFLKGSGLRRAFEG